MCHNVRSLLLSTLLLSTLLLLPLPLIAQTPQADDSRQPITIDADRAELDEKQQIGHYTGNVIITQGGITITADTVTVHTRNNELDNIEADGAPVRYAQRRTGEEDIQGNSRRLEYDADTRIVVLITDAELWQGKNHFRGERIQYDTQSRKVVAGPAVTGNGTGNGTGKRVQIILQPKSEPDAPKP